MRMPTKARSRMPVYSLLAVVTISLLGACAGESTSPLAPAERGTSTLAPTTRSNSGYVVAERVRVDSVYSMLITSQRTSRRP